MDILAANVALEPMFDAANDFVADVFGNLCRHSPCDDDVNGDASDDWPESVFLPKSLAFDAAGIYNRDALSYEAL